MLEKARKMVVPIVQRLINPSIKIHVQVRKMLYACEDLSDEMMRPLFCYWYMKSQSGKYEHSKP